MFRNKMVKKIINTYTNLPDEIIIYTWNFIENNIDMCNLRRTCKTFHKITNKHGYIKELKCSMDNSSYMNYIIMSNPAYHKSLVKITIEYMTNPFDWIPNKWPRKIVFSHCYLGNRKITPPKSITEELTISIFTIGSHYSRLNIDYSLLPELKKVYIVAPDINLEYLEKCQKLESIVINLTKIDNKELPSWIASLPKLKVLIVNFESKEPLHFVSPYLKTLLFYKKYPCTSVVKNIPPIHLTGNIRFNVEAMNHI